MPLDLVWWKRGLSTALPISSNTKTICYRESHTVHCKQVRLIRLRFSSRPRIWPKEHIKRTCLFTAMIQTNLSMLLSYPCVCFASELPNKTQLGLTLRYMMQKSLKPGSGSCHHPLSTVQFSLQDRNIHLFVLFNAQATSCAFSLHTPCSFRPSEWGPEPPMGEPPSLYLDAILSLNYPVLNDDPDSLFPQISQALSIEGVLCLPVLSLFG